MAWGGGQGQRLNPLEECVALGSDALQARGGGEPFGSRGSCRAEGLAGS